MKFIDEKGRLFEKINVIDLLIIALLLCFIPLILFSHKLLLSKRLDGKNLREVIEIPLKFNLLKIRPEVLRLIALGDKELDKKDNPIGEVIWIGEPQIFQHEFNVGANEIIVEDDPLLKKLPVILRLKVEVRENSIYYNDRPITFNYPIIFQTKKYTLQAFLSKGGGANTVFKERWLRVQVNFSNIPFGLAARIKNGDVQLDLKNRVVGRMQKIISNKYIRPQKRKINDKHDIAALLDILCINKDGIYYFNNYPVRIDDTLTFYTDLYSISGTIVSLELK